MPETTVRLFHTRTGVAIADLLYVGTPQWKCGLNEKGAISVTIPVGVQGQIAKNELRSLLVAYRFSLAIVIGSWVAQAGPIISYQYNDSDATLTIVAGGLWHLFDRRLLTDGWMHTDSTYVGSDVYDLHYTSLSLHTIAKRLIQNGVSRLASSLPLVLPSDISGTHERFYPSYDTAYVGERLKQITEVENGPDLEFRPRLVPGTNNIEWVARIGNPLLVQEGAVVTFDYGSSLLQLSTERNGVDRANQILVRGNGTERATPIRTALNTDALSDPYGAPLTDLVITTHTSVSDETVLQGLAEAYLELYRNDVTTWSAMVRADLDPVLGSYDPGHMAQFHVDNHMWLDNGEVQVRLLAIASGSDSQSVSLTVAGI